VPTPEKPRRGALGEFRVGKRLGGLDGAGSCGAYPARYTHLCPCRRIVVDRVSGAHYPCAAQSCATPELFVAFFAYNGQIAASSSDLSSAVSVLAFALSFALFFRAKHLHTSCPRGRARTLVIL